jgi:PilZ domain
MDRREHHRALLNLPVRLRWTTPFGHRTEVCETKNVSRGGLLVPTAEGHNPGVAVWVTFPFDNSLGDGQPEIPATVVRSKRTQNGADHAEARSSPQQSATLEAYGSPKTLVALHFAAMDQVRRNGNGGGREQEKRLSTRRALSLPIRVRLEQIPWFEEAMSMDISANGVRFLSHREYFAGQNLLISFTSPGTAPWTGATEFASRVVRVEPGSQAPALEVSVCRTW